MRYNDTQFNTPQFHILSDKQIKELHYATLQILERTGVSFDCQEAIELLGDAGADVSDTNRVKIPSYMVEQALRTAPKTITLYTRDGGVAMVLNGMTGPHFGSGPMSRGGGDPYTLKKRKRYVEDVADGARLLDALPNIEWCWIGTGGLTLPVTDTGDMSGRIILLHFLLNSPKPIFTEHLDVSSLREMIKVCSIVAGGEEQLKKKPFFGSTSEPISPLTQGKEAMEKSLICAEKGIPNVVYSMPMAGATTPATYAACLATANAELLSQLVVLQLKNPGAPIILGAVCTIMDMKTTICSYGAPEMSLMVGALTELCHHYKLPMFGTAGCTDAAVFGVQAAVEATYEILISALTGADLIHDIGLAYHARMSFPELMVLANEIIDMVKVLRGGIEINDETLALDLIDRLGPGANYLAEPHTLKHFRKFWVPEMFDRSFIKKEGVKDCEEKISEKILEILKNHKPRPPSEDLVKELKKVEKTWLDRLGLKEYPKREQVT